MGATPDFAERIVHTRHADLTAATRTLAAQALLDYLGVTLAGAGAELLDRCRTRGDLPSIEPILQPLWNLS